MSIALVRLRTPCPKETKCIENHSSTVVQLKVIEAVHENIRNHICGECGYAAAQKGVLKRHIEAVHENIKNQIETN